MIIFLVSAIMDRIALLNDCDKNDLCELFPLLIKSKTKEEREEAEKSIVEIIENKPSTLRKL